jgi:hypothetical protein
LANKDSEKKELEERQKYIEKKKKKLKSKKNKKIVGKSFRNNTFSKNFYNKQKQRMMMKTLKDLPDTLQQKIKSSNSSKKN